MRILIPDTWHFHRRNFPSFFDFADGAGVPLWVERSRRRWWRRHGDYRPLAGELAHLLPPLEAATADDLLAWSHGGIPVFACARGEFLCLALPRWAEGAGPSDDRAIIERALADPSDRRDLLLCMAAAIDWIGFWDAVIARHGPFTHALAFSGSYIYTRALQQTGQRAGLRLFALESFFTGNESYFEERATPLSNRSQLADPDYYTALSLPQDPSQRRRIRAEALLRLAAMRNKNVRARPVAVPPPFTAPGGGTVLILGQVLNDFSIIETPLAELSAPAVYRRLITALLERSDLTVVFKAHPWERHRPNLMAPVTLDILRRWAATLPAEHQARLRLLEAEPVKGLFVHADWVVGLCSQGLLEACQAGIKPIQLGRAFFGGRGFTHDYTDIDLLVDGLAAGRIAGRLSATETSAFEDFMARALLLHLVPRGREGVAKIQARLERPRHVPTMTEAILSAGEVELGTAPKLARCIGRRLEPAIASLLSKPVRRAPDPIGSHRAGLLPDLPRRPAGRPLVSVIILNRNGARLLDPLFASIAAHNRWPALDIEVIDHGSADDSREVAARWAERLPIRLTARSGNHSFSHSNNRAAECALGEYLLFLNNDIVFTSDVIGRMVAAAEATGGLVGLGQYENVPADAEGRRPWHHIGVRYQWNPVRRFIEPRNQAPWPGDEALATAACRMPAVTGSVMMCRRDDYLAIGGMSEEYFYGYEDIDLCCKFAFQLGRPVVTLNDATALHGDGTTRKRSGGRRWRRQVHVANMRVFDRRQGFVLWRSLAPLGLADDGSLRGRAPGVAVLGPTSPALEDALAGLARRGWAVVRTGGRSLLDLSGIDLALYADPAVGNWCIRRHDPTLVRVAWTCGAAEAWARRADLPRFDLVVTDGDAAAGRLKAAGAPEIQVLATGGGPETGEILLAALISRRQRAFRFALVAAGREGLRRTAELAQALAFLGQTAWPAHPHAQSDIDSADVVVVLDGAPPACRARPLLAAPPGEDPHAAAQRLLAGARTAADDMAIGPRDPPLPDLAPVTPAGVT